MNHGVRTNIRIDSIFCCQNDTKQDIVHDISTYEVPRRSTNTRQDSSTSVDWKTDSFRLKASHFYYQENGKEPQYFANDSNFIIVPSQLELTGNFWSDSFDVFWPGSDGFDNRLFMFLNGLPMEDTWEVFSVSIYGDNEELIDFISDTNGPPIGISGTLGKCFKSDNKVIANANGDVIVFENLRLAAFLETDRWNDEEYNDCFAGETSTSSKNMDSGLQTSWKFLAVSLLLLLV